MYKCHIGSCTPRRTIMESKKKKKIIIVSWVGSHFNCLQYSYALSTIIIHTINFDVYCHLLSHSWFANQNNKFNFLNGLVYNRLHQRLQAAQEDQSQFEDIDADRLTSTLRYLNQ